MERLLQAALPRGYVAAFRFLRNRDEARDACQEAATRAWAARIQYDADKPFYPWFYRILRNLCIDRLRHRKRSESLVEEPVSTGAHLESSKPALSHPGISRRAS